MGTDNIEVTVEFNGVHAQRTLTDVLFVPGLGSNLFSVAAATTKGLKVTFNDNNVYQIFN